MSSIIDALKKSDHNRNSESSAKLNAIKLGQNPPQKSKRGFWLLVLLLLLVAAGVYAWTQGWHNDLIQYSQNWTGETKELIADNNPTISSETKADSSQTNQSSEQTNANNQLTPPKQSVIKAKSAELRNKQDVPPLPDNKDNMTSSKTDENEIKPIVSGKNNKQAKATSDSEATDSHLDSKKLDSDRKIASQEEPSDKEKKAKEEKALQPKRKQDYLLLHQIDFAIRKNIPTVKVNIHIYDPLPENRMVLINGERFNIGDTIEELVTIEDIVQEGVVVKFENVKFLIPK
jgi:CHASE3 domain sensor protein